MCDDGSCHVGYVEDAVMWELGSSVYLAVVTTHPAAEARVQLFSLDLETRTWTAAGSLLAGLQGVTQMKVFQFRDGGKESVHLFVVR